ncbi:MAG: alkaline phosphatase family protein [Clostridia bacterium]|nr:alkaline phosphatase family protein [Clostridia bacterium]
MSTLYNSLPITSCCRTVCDILDVPCGEQPADVNQAVKALCDKAFAGRKADRALLYNPDAIALWLYQNYTHLFTDAMVCSQLAIPMLSVMPSVTPVCFGSMYTGLMPDDHGIKKYVKPVLTVDTIFDYFIRAGKKCAIVSTTGDSISEIFLNREMDYFIYDTVEEINLKALELIEKDEYDLLVVYNANYDGTMHKTGPEAPEAMEALKANIWTYQRLVQAVEEHWQSHDVVYGFMPDHGCHQIDKGAGSHGLDMEEDMNIIHFYGAKPRKV